METSSDQISWNTSVWLVNYIIIIIIIIIIMIIIIIIIIIIVYWNTNIAADNWITLGTKSR